MGNNLLTIITNVNHVKTIENLLNNHGYKTTKYDDSNNKETKIIISVVPRKKRKNLSFKIKKIDPNAIILLEKVKRA